MVSFFAGVFFVACSFLQLSAQHKQAESADVIKVRKTADFMVSGQGSSPDWQKTGWHRIHQRSNKTLLGANWRIPAADSNYQAPLYLTDFKILYSDKGIYCLYRCEDSLITASLKGDYLNLFNEDVVEAFFWPDTGIPVYFEYELSPLNFELPLLNVNQKGKLMNWQPWRYEGAKKTVHAVYINERNAADKRCYWTAEFFIPFTLIESLKNIPPEKGTKWQANFYRIDYDNKKPVYSSWQLPRENFNDPGKFGTLEFE